MTDRRQLLLGMAGAMAGRAMRQHVARSRQNPGQMVIVRRGGHFVQVDSRSGATDTIDLPRNTRRVTQDPASASILVELDSGAWRVGPSVGDATLQVEPVPPDTSPLLVAGRLIGASVAGQDRAVHDLLSSRSDVVSSGILPGPPGSWQVHRHPVLPGALLDARRSGGGVVLLPAGTSRTPQAMAVPSGSAVGIAADGAGLVRIDRMGDLSAVVCMHASLENHHDPVSRLMLGTGRGEVYGPIGASTNELLVVGDGWMPVVSCDDADLHLVDEVVINSADDDRGVGTWFASPDGDAMIVGLTHESLLSWAWWAIGRPPSMMPELPSTLEPGVHAGAAGRWFHGADLNETSLGSGELRLMTIDMESGEVVFDETVDRRLELAATSISTDGSVLAHCQSGNAEIELRVATFDEMVTNHRFRIDIEDAPVAAADIMLDVAATDGAGVVAAGLKWGNPEHHEPMVVVSVVGIGGPAAPLSIDGELIGVVSQG